MRSSIRLVFLLVLPVLFGCSPEKKEAFQSPPPPEEIKALSQLDREKIATYGKSLFDLDKISAKAMALVGNEIRQVVMGQKESVDAASLLEGAKGEARKALDGMLSKAVPEGLPPWFSRNLEDAKRSFSDAYAAKIASFDAVRRSIDEKNPVALVEYKQKAALAEKSFRDARAKLDGVLNALRFQPVDPGKKAGETGK